MKTLRTTDRNFRYDFSKLYQRQNELNEKAGELVADILDDVRRVGDNAIIKYTERYDGYTPVLRNLEVGDKEKKAAHKLLSHAQVAALKTAAHRIEEYHRRQVEKSWEVTKGGITYGQVLTPLGRVGVYVPGGKAVYPSTVLMTAIPAKVARVGEIIMVSPAPKGEIHPSSLVAAEIAGVNRIFKIGGAQGVGALAYGTKTVPKVDKIVGPGNLFVTLAKKQVFGVVDVDMVAGPSEILVLADDFADPAHIAADMLSQAEHDEMACAILITTSAKLAMRVDGEVRKQLVRLKRRRIAESSLKHHGVLVLAKTLEEAVDLINEIAPEHLELMVKEARALVPRIKNCGAIFVGPHSPEAIGDYVAGPSHVLPTQGTARFYSPLGVHDFVKRTSIIEATAAALREVGPVAITLAEMEGLTAHAESIRMRLHP